MPELLEKGHDYAFKENRDQIPDQSLNKNANLDPKLDIKKRNALRIEKRLKR